MMKALCILTNGFEEIEAIGTIAILKRSGFDVDIFSLKGENATGRYNVKIQTPFRVDELNKSKYDLLFIPGGPQYIELESSDIVKETIEWFIKNDKFVAAICAAPTILGHMGLFNGKRYTCFSSMNEDFGGYYIDKYYAVDGKIITGKSAAATIDFAFAIVEAMMGKEHAEKIKNSIYYYSK